MSSGRRGFTLTEVLVAAVILGIMVLAVMPVIRLSQQGFASMEARNSLKTESQSAMNRIGQRLAETKRFFENTPSDVAFQARAAIGTMPLSGSALPAIEEMGSLSPSSGTFIPTSVGNRLFFASVVPSVDVSVLDSASVTQNVRIDAYMFNAYYLAVDNTVLKPIGGQPRRALREWRSATYADYNQLTGIPDSVERANATRAVAARGIGYAWNPSTGSVSDAFYSIDPLTGALTVRPTHVIAQASSAEMMKVNTGITFGSYRWGVCPNTAALTVKHPVPQFAPALGAFPSGFEVVAVGPSSARQVFLRLVVAAEGSFPGLITVEQVLLTTVRDLY